MINIDLFLSWNHTSFFRRNYITTMKECVNMLFSTSVKAIIIIRVRCPKHIIVIEDCPVHLFFLLYIGLLHKKYIKQNLVGCWICNIVQVKRVIPIYKIFIFTYLHGKCCFYWICNIYDSQSSHWIKWNCGGHPQRHFHEVSCTCFVKEYNKKAELEGKFKTRSLTQIKLHRRG